MRVDAIVSLRYRLGAGDLSEGSGFANRSLEYLLPLSLSSEGHNGQAGAWPCLRHLPFWRDPETSVLDPWNRAHGLSNLYIVDASFFPTSGGLNPALTIAANALRVAHHLQIDYEWRTKMTLVTLADEQYAVPLAVLGRSLSENIRSDRAATLYIVDGGITPETKTSFDRFLGSGTDPC